MSIMSKRARFALGIAALAIAAPLTVGLVQAQMTTEEVSVLEQLTKALLDDTSRLPADSPNAVYEAQYALTIDRYINTGTGAGSGAGSASGTASNQQCSIVLRAIGDALAQTKTANARNALLTMRTNLRSCRGGGTGAGAGTGGSIITTLPGPGSGGGSNYVS